MRARLDRQLQGKGFSFAEILTMCPTGRFIPTAEGPGHLDRELGAVHEVGELKRDGMVLERQPARSTPTGSPSPPRP